MSESNPFKPEQYLDHQHVNQFVSEALQEWAQRKKLPFNVEGPRGLIEVSTQDLYRMSAVVRAVLNDNKDTVDKWMAHRR